MRIIPIILLILSLAECKHYFVRDAAKYNLTEEEENILKSKKIGIIGFHPFYLNRNSCCSEESNQFLNKDLIRTLQFVYQTNDSEKIPFNQNFFVTRTGNRRREQRLGNRNTAKEFLKLESILDKPSDAKPDKSISENNLRNFLKTYLDTAKHLGYEELEKHLDFSDKNNIYFKKNNFDYWIIGFHSPEKYETDDKAVLTFLPFLSSLGIFPFCADEPVNSIFWIFDKKLNLLKQISFENNYELIAASWVIWKEENTLLGDDLPIEVFEPDLKEFSKELARIVKEAK